MKSAKKIYSEIINDDVMDRLYAKCDKVGDCLVWSGSKSKSVGGYGRINILNSLYGVHRVAWTYVVGEIDDGVIILHSCDNPLCCNVKHMRVGTQFDNMADMNGKGRRVNAVKKKGADSFLSSLTKESVIAIKRDYVKYHEQFGGVPLAKKYSVSSATISRVVNGVRYE